MATPFVLTCELSEKQVEADVATFLGFHSSHYGEFRLLDVNEQLTGADKQLNWRGAAFFLQFKLPIGLTPLHVSPPRPPRQPLMLIRLFRLQNRLDQNPYSLCFPLRRRAANAPELQHNVLLRYERPPNSRAIYVCPLSLTKREYELSMRADRDTLDVPFSHLHPQWVVAGRYLARAAEVSPFLRGHVSIVPHEAVTSDQHYYSFSAHGTDIAFHQPKLLTKRPSRLSDFVAKEIRRALGVRDLAAPSYASPGELATSLFDASTGWSRGVLPDPAGEEDKFDWLTRHGQALDSEFGIRQIIALAQSA